MKFPDIIDEVQERVLPPGLRVNFDDEDPIKVPNLIAGNSFTDPAGEEYTGEIIPEGVITMWSGEADNIPEGWTLCDGYGAPDLTGRFIVAAGPDYPVGDTGGEELVSLVEAELPSHDHASGGLSASSHDHGDGTLSTSQDGDHSHSYDDPNTVQSQLVSGDFSTPTIQISDNQTGTAGAHSHGVTGSTGSASPSVSGTTDTTGDGMAHENRPPYLALAYIMKVPEDSEYSGVGAADGGGGGGVA